MARLESQILRFLLFLEADGRDWVYAGPYDIMVYLGDVYRGRMSAITSFYCRIGMPAPGLISPRALHTVVKGALEWYRCRKAIHKPSAGPGGATEIE
jgi:hypothetical protein